MKVTLNVSFKSKSINDTEICIGKVIINNAMVLLQETQTILLKGVTD